MPHEERFLPARAVTRGPKHHFFGYYEKSPWDSSSRYLLALETGFADRPPVAGDVGAVGLIDTGNDDAWRPLDETTAWNWQQGTMLQWLPDSADRRIIYNVRVGDRFGAVIRDVFSGEHRLLPRPVYAINPAGGTALSANFARLAHSRPGYGYAPGAVGTTPVSARPGAGVPGRYGAGALPPGCGHVGTSEVLIDDPAPDDDGIYHVDLETGECRLVLSLAEAASLRPRPDVEGAFHWINHIQWNVDGTRFAFLHRWQGPKTGRKWFTRLLTAQPDGSEPRILADEETVSHYDWLGTGRVLAWSERSPTGQRYFLYRDAPSGAVGTTPASARAAGRSASGAQAGPGEAEVVGEGILTCDGHCSYSPDRSWILTDTYPDGERTRTLVLFRPEDSRRVDVGRFHAPPELVGEVRCDLHPRWSRDGRSVCFDSAHEGSRQLYVMDVSGVVES